MTENMASNLYQQQVVKYLDKIIDSHPDATKFITIQSHKELLTNPIIFTFPKPIPSRFDWNAGVINSVDVQNIPSSVPQRYFITNIILKLDTNNLDDYPMDQTIKLICGGQTWISGQLCLLDTTALNKLVIPLPASNVLQDIILVIENESHRSSICNYILNFDVILAPEFQDEDIYCYQQIIRQIPSNCIIHDSRNTILNSQLYRINRIEVYVPADLNIHLPLEYTHIPKIYCEPITDDITLVKKQKPTNNPHYIKYNTYCFKPNSFSAVIMLDQQLTIHPTIKYSIIEKQIIKMKNGYIGLAF